MPIRIIFSKKGLFNIVIFSGLMTLGLMLYMNLENNENSVAKMSISSLQSKIYNNNSRKEPQKLLIRSNFSSTYYSFSGQQDGIQNNCIFQNVLNLGNETKNRLFKSIIVVEKYKWLYCLVPKVGCSNWKRVIQMLYGTTNLTIDRELSMKEVHTRSKFVYLSDFSPDEINTKLRDYYKFMFVRHPMARIYSAYKSKFVTRNDYFRSRFGKKIIKTFRKNLQVDLNSTSDIKVSFEEFARYLANTPVENMEYHWMPIYEICQPCFANYNYIGYLERMKEDSDKLLQILNAPKAIQFPIKQSGYHTATTSEREKAFNEIPSDIVNKIISKFSLDFKLFGYNLPIVNSKGGYKE